MSPIVYMPPRPHECRPPRQGQRYIANYGGLYPAGTIWECDECGIRWELGYDCYHPERVDGSTNGAGVAKVIWNRLDD